MMLHVNQQRLDELTEWCRNKPEEAAHRLMVAEGTAQKVKPYDYPGFVVVQRNREGEGPLFLTVEADSEEWAEHFHNAMRSAKPVEVGGQEHMVVRQYESRRFLLCEFHRAIQYRELPEDGVHVKALPGEKGGPVTYVARPESRAAHSLLVRACANADICVVFRERTFVVRMDHGECPGVEMFRLDEVR